MKAKLIKNGNAYSLKINGEYVAFVNEDFIGYATQEFRDNLLPTKLSLKNCQAIERGYDLDELAISTYPFDSKADVINAISQQAYIKGFQKCLEILGDKKFSEEDVNLAFVLGKNKDESRIGKLINSKLQQTEWDVEIEMGYKRLNSDGCEIGFPDMTTPKLDAYGCLILKII